MSTATKSNFYIGNNGPYRAKSIKQSNESLASEDSGRTDDGKMHITMIKPLLRKWEIELPPCSSDEVYTIMSQVQGKIYNITIWDLTKSGTDKSNTVQVYTSSTSADCYSGVIAGGLYQGVTFSAIEMG